MRVNGWIENSTFCIQPWIMANPDAHNQRAPKPGFARILLSSDANSKTAASVKGSKTDVGDVEGADRGPSPYHLGPKGSLRVVAAGREVYAGWTLLAEASAVAALSCCTGRRLNSKVGLWASLGSHRSRKRDIRISRRRSRVYIISSQVGCPVKECSSI
jgi:hypothetical protein